MATVDLPQPPGPSICGHTGQCAAAGWTRPWACQPGQAAGGEALDDAARRRQRRRPPRRRTSQVRRPVDEQGARFGHGAKNRPAAAPTPRPAVGDPHRGAAGSAGHGRRGAAAPRRPGRDTVATGLATAPGSRPGDTHTVATRSVHGPATAVLPGWWPPARGHRPAETTPVVATAIRPGRPGPWPPATGGHLWPAVATAGGANGHRATTLTRCRRSGRFAPAAGSRLPPHPLRAPGGRVGGGGRAVPRAPSACPARRTTTTAPATLRHHPAAVWPGAPLAPRSGDWRAPISGVSAPVSSHTETTPV